MANVLIIDDDELFCETLLDKLRRIDHDGAYALNLKDGLKKAFSGKFDVVFLDVRLPDGNGLNMLPRLRAAPSSPEVIIITGYGDPDGAEHAIKSDAWHYVEKSSSIKEMILPFLRALQYREEKKTTSRPVALKRENIIANSPRMIPCFDLLAKAAASEVNVLIVGETGTGKELFARAIHENSLRADKNFVIVDCAVLPETLIGSMLFGHEKGAFTGADKNHEGMIKQADGGTLFLDEVGELILPVQKAFLRILEKGTFRSVGGKKEVRSDFRLVAATNRDLDDMVRQKQFREDLLFRLRSLTIELPPLRERSEDIKDLAINHITKLCEWSKTEIKGFSPDFFETLSAYEWPGNVRELFNNLDRAFAVAGSCPTLFRKHLPDQIRIHALRSSVDKRSPADSTSGEGVQLTKTLPAWKEFRGKAEQEYLKDLISCTKGDIKKACQLSSLSRARLYQLLKKYGLKLG